MSEDGVVLAKTALMDALGDNSAIYLSNMKLWFRKKWSKNEFDEKCRKLLPIDQMHLHNKFLLAILNKIDSVMPIATPSSLTMSNHSVRGPTNLAPTSSLSAKKRKRLRMSDHLAFDPADVMDYLSEENTDLMAQHHNQEASNGGTPIQERYSVQELFLPDNGLVMGRLLIGAWEVGLVNADETAAELIGQAVQMLLKNILQTILMKRKSFKTASDGMFVYDVGAVQKDLFTRNTVTRSKVDDSPVELDKEITSMSMPRVPNEEPATVVLADCEELYSSSKRGRRRISMLDLYLTLKCEPSVIPSHSIHSINVERISNLLENNL